MSISKKRHKVLYVDTLSTNQAKNNTHGMCAAYADVADLRTFDYRGITRTRGIDAMNSRLISLALSFRPSLIHLGKCESVRPKAIEKIKQSLDVGIIHLYGDYRPKPPSSAIELGKVADCLFLQCNDSAFFDVFRRQGVDCIEPFSSGTDTETMYSETTKKRFDVVFFGNRQTILQGHRFRNQAIDYLRKNGVDLHVFGNKWPMQHPKHHPFVSGKKFRRMANAARINLAIGGMFHVNECTSWPRMFNPMACGTFTLCKRFKGVESILTPDEHVVLFDTLKECLFLVKKYLRNLTERERIARRGSTFIRLNHNWDKKIEQFMRYSK